MEDLVNHPKHYTVNSVTIDGITLEPIDVLEHTDFTSGNALKYLLRAKHKGNELQDLKKALWYLERIAYGSNARRLESVTFDPNKASGVIKLDVPGCLFAKYYGNFLSWYDEANRKFKEVLDKMFSDPIFKGALEAYEGIEYYGFDVQELIINVNHRIKELEH